jgi:hypothetical protein
MRVKGVRRGRKHVKSPFSLRDQEREAALLWRRTASWGVSLVGGKRTSPALFHSFVYIDEKDEKIFKI